MFSKWYALVHTATKYMTSTHVHSLYKQNSPLCRLDLFFDGSCEDIVRLLISTRESLSFTLVLWSKRQSSGIVMSAFRSILLLSVLMKSKQIF